MKVIRLLNLTFLLDENPSNLLISQKLSKTFIQNHQTKSKKTINTNHTNTRVFIVSIFIKFMNENEICHTILLIKHSKFKELSII